MPDVSSRDRQKIPSVKLLLELAEECREAAGQTQLMVTTHSPFFNGLTKIAVAQNISENMVPKRNRSKSFQMFRQGLLDMVG